MEISNDIIFIVVIGLIAMAIFCTCNYEGGGKLHEGFGPNIADADISAIRNLNGLANTLMQPNGTLTNPGNLKVSSGLTVGGSGQPDLGGPGPQTRINDQGIIFGGANNDREANSAQISAGRHEPDSLCIVGMSNGNKANRKITMWSEGGAKMYGNMNITNGGLTVNNRDILAELDSLKQNAVMKSSQQGQCRDVNTGFNNEGGGNAVFLDRHNISCGANETLQQFKLSRSGGGEYRYDYKCCKSA